MAGHPEKLPLYDAQLEDYNERPNCFQISHLALGRVTKTVLQADSDISLTEWLVVVAVLFFFEMSLKQTNHYCVFYFSPHRCNSIVKQKIVIETAINSIEL